MKRNGKLASLQRHQLDQTIRRIKSLLPASPKDGWIRTIRLVLGMTGEQLASKLGVTRQAIASYEKEECRGMVTLSTLRKVANVLNCDVAVVFVPRESLESLVRARALSTSEKIIERTELHMKMEAQGTEKAFRKRQIKEQADEMIRRLDKRIWD